MSYAFFLHLAPSLMHPCLTYIRNQCILSGDSFVLELASEKRVFEFGMSVCELIGFVRDYVEEYSHKR